MSDDTDDALEPYAELLEKGPDALVHLYGSGPAIVNINSYAKYHANRWRESRRPEALQELELVMRAWQEYKARRVPAPPGPCERSLFEEGDVIDAEGS